MLFASIATAVIGLLGTPVAASPIESRDVLADLQVQAMDALKLREAESGSVNKLGSCNLFNARYRRDWFVFLPSRRDMELQLTRIQGTPSPPKKGSPTLVLFSACSNCHPSPTLSSSPVRAAGTTTLSPSTSTSRVRSMPR